MLGHGPRVECCFRDLSWQSPGWRPEQLMWMVSRQPDALGTGGFPEKSVACCADDTISWCLLGCFSIMTTTMLHERCYRTVCRADTEIHFDPFWFLQFPFMKLRHRQPEATLLKKQWILSPLPTWWQIAWRMCFSFTWNCQTNISQIRVQHCLTMMVSYESCTIYLCPFYPLHLDNLEQFALHTWLSDGWVPYQRCLLQDVLIWRVFGHLDDTTLSVSSNQGCVQRDKDFSCQHPSDWDMNETW